MGRELVVRASIEVVDLLFLTFSFDVLIDPLLVHLVEAADVEHVAAAEVLHRRVAVLYPHRELLHPVPNRNASEAGQALVVCSCLTSDDAVGSGADEAEGWPSCVRLWLWLFLLFRRLLTDVGLDLVQLGVLEGLEVLLRAACVLVGLLGHLFGVVLDVLFRLEVGHDLRWLDGALLLLPLIPSGEEAGASDGTLVVYEEEDEEDVLAYLESGTRAR